MKTAVRAAAFAFVAVLCGPACRAQTPTPSSSPVAAPQNEDQKAFYALGVMMGQNIRALNLTAEELELVKKGLADAATGKSPELNLPTYSAKLQELARARAKVTMDTQKEKGQAYQETAAKEQGAVKTASGLIFSSLKPGSGKSPAASDTVKVHYRGTLIDGTEFDSSIKRGAPAEFPLNAVIPCWTEGVQKMKVGEKARLVCPSSIAYGDQGRPPSIPPGATLVFEVELLDARLATPPPAVPSPTPSPKKEERK